MNEIKCDLNLKVYFEFKKKKNSSNLIELNELK